MNLDLISDDWTEEQRAAIEAYESAVDWDHYQYADNFRIARKDRPDEVANYERLAREGCCGSYDDEFEAGGTTILYGFHYGH
jgi:hypothetical protein